MHRSVDKLCIQACKGLKKLDSADFNAHVTETFTTRLSDGSEVELKPDGRRIAVTPENVEEFVDLVLKARLSEGSAQVRVSPRVLAVQPTIALPPTRAESLTHSLAHSLTWRRTICVPSTSYLHLSRL